MNELKINLGVGLHERARALAEGLVKVDGLELNVTMSNDDGGLHSAMIDGRFDACELSLAMSTYMCGHDRPFIAIPVFPNRRFRHSFIYVNSQSGIDSPKDLVGKKVASGGWVNTASVWVRALLSHNYGVDLTEVCWLVSRPTDPELRRRLLRVGIVPELAESETPLVDQLVAGQIDALIVPSVIAPIRNKDFRVRRLFSNYKEVERQYYLETGIIPISHVVAIRRELWENEPSIAEKLLQAWEQAKRISVAYTKHPGHSNLLWYGSLKEEEDELFRIDPWTYNLADNRNVLEAFMQFSWEQGIADEIRPVDDMFAL